MGAVLMLTAIFPLEQAAASSPEAEKIIYAFRDTVYLQTVDDNEIERLYEKLLIELEDLAIPSRELSYRKAQAAYYLGRWYQAPDTVEHVLVFDDYVRKGRFKKVQASYGRLDEIIALYEESLALLESYMEEGRDSRSVLLYAESLSQLSTLKTLGFLMKNGPKIRPLAEEALALDAGNVKAQMLLASRYIFSPEVWGGNPDKGIAMIEAVVAAAGENREDRHNVAVAIGYAHTMAGRWEEAAQSFRKALEVYPTNVYALGMLKLSEMGGASGL